VTERVFNAKRSGSMIGSNWRGIGWRASLFCILAITWSIAVSQVDPFEDLAEDLDLPPAESEDFDPFAEEAERTWKPDWTVACTWQKRMEAFLIEQSIELALELLEGYTELPFTEAKEKLLPPLCDDSHEANRGAWDARRELRASEAWYRSLGFGPPYVITDPDDDRKHLAYIDSGTFVGFSKNNPTAYVEENGYYYPNGEIYISPTILQKPWATGAHELFHGIQQGAMVKDGDHDDDDYWEIFRRKWISEGTARAVESVWAAKQGVARDYKIETRRYDISLDSSYDEKGDWASGYGTASFWRDVGRQLRAEDRIGYLRTVLERLGEQGRNNSTGIEVVDEVLGTLFVGRGGEQGGLYRAFPEFVRFQLDEPGLRSQFFSTRPDGNSNKETVDLELALEQNHIEHLLHDSLPRVAARGYVLNVRLPAGTKAGLRIDLDKGRLQDQELLHLIVDRNRFNRHPTPQYPGLRRNVFMEAIEGTGDEQQFYVRVANVGRTHSDNRQAIYTLRFSLTELSPCESDVMMSAMHPKAQTAMSSRLMGWGTRSLLPADQYEEQFEEEPGLHPAKGKLFFRGIVNDGGTACTEPLGVNPTLGLYADDEGVQERFVEAINRMMSKSTPDTPEIEKALEAIAESRDDESLSVIQKVVPGLMDDAEVRSGVGAVMESMVPEGDVIISVYSPNAVSWQLGTPALPISPGWQLFKHKGLDDWKPNTGGHFTFRLPGVSPAKLREGETYPAEMVRTATAEGTILYSLWEGRESVESCRGITAPLLKGSTKQLTAEEMTGEVTVTRITGASVEGNFKFEGRGRLEKTKFKISRFGGCKSMVPKADIDKGRLQIRGEFAAPAMINTQRPGRAVSLTWAGNERVPEDNDWPLVAAAFYPPPIDDLGQEDDRSLWRWWLLLALLSLFLDSDVELPDGIDIEDFIDREGRIVLPMPEDPEQKDCIGSDCDEPPPKKCVGPECVDPCEDCIPDPCDHVPCGPFPRPDPVTIPVDGDLSSGGGPYAPPPSQPSDMQAGSGNNPPAGGPGIDPPDSVGQGDERLLGFGETNSDLRSGPQTVIGIRPQEPGGMRVVGARHQVRMTMDPGDVTDCQMPGMLGAMLVGGTTITVDIDMRVAANQEQAELLMTNRREASSIRMAAGGDLGGTVRAASDSSGGLRIAISGGHFKFSSQGVEVACDGVADFVATLAGHP
jgi:hypothetical protein